MDRFTIVSKRQLDVLDKHLEGGALLQCWVFHGRCCKSMVMQFGAVKELESFLRRKIKNRVEWTEKIKNRVAVPGGSIMSKS